MRIYKKCSDGGYNTSSGRERRFSDKLLLEGTGSLELEQEL